MLSICSEVVEVKTSLKNIQKMVKKLRKTKSASLPRDKGEWDIDAGSEADENGKNVDYDTTLEAAKWTFSEYFKESSIHGFKYIGNHKHSIPDRFIWLCALVLSIITCCFYIRNIWDQRNNNPVIVSFNEKLTPVWEIPFPTVTICPESKTNLSIFNITDVYWKIMDDKNITEEELFYWEGISQICEYDEEDFETLFYEKYGTLLANASDLIQALKMAEPKSDPELEYCLWRNSIYCSDLFQRIITEDGICLSFNSLTSNYYSEELIKANIQDDDFYNSTRNLNWNVETGYQRGNDIETIPKRVIGTGVKEGLVIYLNSEKGNENLLCRRHSRGYKIILHTPGEEPQVSKHYINAQADKLVLITIEPEIVSASEELRNYDPQGRQCYYQEERTLRYFNLYSQANCQQECLANKTLEKCGCVKFSMPRNLNHPVCGSKQVKCFVEAESYVNEMNFINTNNINQHQSNDPTSFCNCLPLCSSIQYKAVLANQNEYDWLGFLKTFKSEEVLINNPGLQFTQVKIHFKEELFKGLKRSELCSKSDFIANCGGLLGLFMGVSILSLVEVVYFFTIKLFVNLKERKLRTRLLNKIKETP